MFQKNRFVKSGVEFFKLLTPGQKRRLILIQCLFAINSLLELVSIAGIAPFIAVLANNRLVEEQQTFARFFALLGFESTRTFIGFLGAAVLFVIIVANSFALLTLRYSTNYVYRLSSELGRDLFSYYVGRDYLFHVYSNSARLSSNIQAEVRRLADTVLIQVLNLNSRMVTLVFIGTGLMILDPFLTLLVFITLLSGYFGVLSFIRRELSERGVAATETYVGRGKALQEAFGGIKEIKAFRKEPDFLRSFDKWNQAYNSNVARSAVLAAAPKNIMEMVAFGGMIAIMLYLFKTSPSFGELIPVLSLYAMAGFKLMPALQQCFHALAYINGNINAFDVLARDLGDARSASSLREGQAVLLGEQKPLIVSKGIELRHVNFRYPSGDRKVLDDVSLLIPANRTVALVGASG
ncbi:MAG: ABC transporter transmembrane domain-containing protein, partial [Oligoflexia bacterium]|nr:ABC transporter transmembrane domain-containing protein [Oligoflexia bacterium]